jgi:hypothetical protein
MPVKRRTPKTRLHAAIEMTSERWNFLIHGHDFFDDKPFTDTEEARICWETHRDEILATPDCRIPPGCRPWGFWKFDAKSQTEHGPIPTRQAAALDALGLLSEQEKAIVIQLARAAWLRHVEYWNEPHRTQARLATDQQLLDAWPDTWYVEYTGKPKRTILNFEAGETK